ncbi:MAG TPA: hypothetical protein VJM83_02540 [Nitrospirota bacterium]|nr:hypothetical protein [Nitrospirota bacterium]
MDPQKRFLLAALVVLSPSLLLLMTPLESFCAPGSVVWETTYVSRSGEDSAHARSLVLDAHGNIAVTGYINGRQGNYNCVTIRYGPYGTTEWAREYVRSWYDVGRAAVFDITGNVIVAAASNNLENPRDGYTGTYYTDNRVLKYDAAGELLSEAQASGNLKNNEPWAVAVDEGGGIYVAGGAMDAPGNHALYYTVKFDPDGALVWERLEDWGSDSAATGIAAEKDGRIIISGYFMDPSAGNYSIRTLRYAPEGGNPLMDVVYNYQFEDEKAYALALDPDGNIIITGESASDGGITLTLKYGPDGGLLWAERYRGSELKNRGNAVATDRFGRIYVAGRTFREDQGSPGGDFLLLVYGKDGNLIDYKTYPFGGDSSAEGVAIDAYGNVVMAGTTVMPGQSGIIRTVRVEGYPYQAGLAIPPEGLFAQGAHISLRPPARPMVRQVELDADRADPADPGSGYLLTASPVAAPGDYEYRFYTMGRNTAHHWERLTDYTDSDFIILPPEPGRPARVMVEVRAKGSDLKYEARRELDIEDPD